MPSLRPATEWQLIGNATDVRRDIVDSHAVIHTQSAARFFWGDVLEIEAPGGLAVSMRVRLATTLTSGSVKPWIRIEGDGGFIGSVTGDAITSELNGEFERSISMVIPPGTRVAWVGLIVAGVGDVRLMEADLDTSQSATYVGQVVDEQGTPVAGAQVAAWAIGLESPVGSATSDEEGRFSVSLPNGAYQFSFASEALTSSVTESSTEHSLVAVLNEDVSGEVLRGQVVSAGSPLRGNRSLRVTSASGIRWQTPVSERGTFAIRVPPGQYDVWVDDDSLLQEGLTTGVPADVTLSAHDPVDLAHPAGSSVVDALSSVAVKGEQFAAAIAARVGPRSVVSLGEPTHGTAQSYVLRLALLKRLVADNDFRGLVLETNFAETLAVDAYVRGGIGDLGEALAGTHFWIVQTQELADLLMWMRDYNSAHPAQDPLRVFGADMQYTDGAIRVLEEMLERAGSRCNVKSPALDPLRDPRSPYNYKKADASVKEGTQKAMSELARCVTKDAKKLKRKLGIDSWIPSRLAETLLQSEQLLRLEVRDRGHARDELMAANVQWARDHLNSGVLVALHDMHGAYGEWGSGNRSTGEHLRHLLGDDYYSVGFLVAEGAFLAFDNAHGVAMSPGVVPIELPPPPVNTLLDTLSQVDDGPLFIDLSDAKVSSYFAEWHLLRFAGSAISQTSDAEYARQPAKMFDAIIFKKTSLPSTPLPGAVLREL